VGAALGGIRDSQAKGVSDAAEIASKMIGRWYASAETFESWKKLAEKMNIMTDHAAELGLVKQVMDGNAISKFFAQNKWRDVAIDAIDKHRDKLGRRLFFHKAHADPALLKTLMADAVSPPLSAYEKAMAERAMAKAGRTVLWAVDTFVSVKQIVDTAHELHELHATEEVATDRLHKHMEEYAKRFQSAPCTEAIARLEVLRKAADAATMGMDEKTFEAVETAAKLTLRALTSVPVVGEFAALSSKPWRCWAASSTWPATRWIDSYGAIAPRSLVSASSRGYTPFSVEPSQRPRDTDMTIRTPSSACA
jgi:hypothetical protein